MQRSSPRCVDVPQGFLGYPSIQCGQLYVTLEFLLARSLDLPRGLSRVQGLSILTVVTSCPISQPCHPAWALFSCPSQESAAGCAFPPSTSLLLSALLAAIPTTQNLFTLKGKWEAVIGMGFEEVRRSLCRKTVNERGLGVC